MMRGLCSAPFLRVSFPPSSMPSDPKGDGHGLVYSPSGQTTYPDIPPHLSPQSIVFFLLILPHLPLPAVLRRCELFRLVKLEGTVEECGIPSAVV